MPSAGDIVRAADVALTLHEVRASANTNIEGTTWVDITGATVTFTTSKANVECVVMCAFDINHTSTGNGLARGRLMVDGVAETVHATLEDDTERATVYQVYAVTLASAGSHTLKLQGSTALTAGATLALTFTGFVATVYDVTT